MNLPILNNTIPIKAKPIWKGMKSFISFLTPEREVYVDDPVKFIARNEEIAVIMRNHDDCSTIVDPEKFISIMIINTNNPERKPLMEKYLPGIYGRRDGVITIPAT